MNLQALGVSSSSDRQTGEGGFLTISNRAMTGRDPTAKEPGSTGLHRRTSRGPHLLGLGLALISALNTFAAAVELRIKQAGFDTNGAALLDVTGPAPGVYQLESSEDMNTWEPVTKDVLIRGTLRLVDPRGQAHVRRFYRAVLTDEPAYQPGVVLLRFKAEANVATMDTAMVGMRIHKVEELLTPAMAASGCPSILCAHTTLSVPEAVAELANNPAIEFAEPNFVVRHSVVSNDPNFADGSLWGMYGDASSPANTFGSQAAEAWQAGYTGSRHVYVGVIDEGIQISHPDLAPNIWANRFDPPNGIDDDGNGFVDDLNGWDFFEGNNSVFDGAPNNPEVDAHGTHVAGTIGGVGGNGLGVAGVNWEVTIISGKFIGPDWGYTDDAIKAIDYFTDLKQRHGLNIVALNNSWGGGGYARGLHEAILRAAKANILFIAAAGNEFRNNDSSPSYPSGYDTTKGTPGESAASYDSVVSVAAIGKDGSLAVFSNYGARTVDLGAPGVGVLSTVPWLNYASYGGTSMATPHVTGAAALYASTHPGTTAAEIREAILGSTTPTASLTGKCVTGGRLNLSTIIKAPPIGAPPVAPSSLKATFSSDINAVLLSWSDDSSNEEGFIVERSTNGGDYMFVKKVSRDATETVDKEFTWSASVSYRIVAFRGSTISPPSNVDSVNTPPKPRLIYVDATYHGGSPDGSSTRPFPSLTRAHAVASDGNIIRIRSNTYREHPLLTKRVRIEPIGGAVQIIP